jgi:hypothetical protein
VKRGSDNEKPRCLHRELAVRSCASCGSYLSSANEDQWCFACGGWTTHRLSAVEAMAQLRGREGIVHREKVGEALEELITA